MAENNSFMDATRWDRFTFRDGDVIVGSWARPGTRWVQTIVGQLLIGPRERLALEVLSPWIERRLMPLEPLLDRLDAQEHRRFVETHLPANLLPVSLAVQYVFVGRDPRETAWNMFKFQRNRPNRPGPTAESGAQPRVHFDDFSAFFASWLEQQGGRPWWPYWAHVRSWWNIKTEDNVHFIHFNELKNDLRGTVVRLAEFLDVELDPTRLEEILLLCEEQQAGARNARRGADAEEEASDDADDWREVLGAAELAAYETAAARELDPECCRWLTAN